MSDERIERARGSLTTEKRNDRRGRDGKGDKRAEPECVGQRHTHPHRQNNTKHKPRKHQTPSSVLFVSCRAPFSPSPLPCSRSVPVIPSKKTDKAGAVLALWLYLLLSGTGLALLALVAILIIYCKGKRLGASKVSGVLSYYHTIIHSYLMNLYSTLLLVVYYG